MNYVMKRISVSLFAILLLLQASTGLTAQTVQGSDIPVNRIALFSSGVGYFEHTAKVSGNAETILPFNLSAINDALKSLVISDPSSNSPSVSYPSEDTLLRTLRSLKIDLSGNPGVAQILSGLRGAEVQVFTPQIITGRIIGVEQRFENETKSPVSFVSLYTKDGIKVIALSEIVSFTFTDKKIAEDLNRGLDLILSSKDIQKRNLQIHLPGKGEREVTLAYVIAAPVWKVSYRLDLAGDKPVLQGWAIVDNSGDIDWNGVELSLVTGRPVSFIQNLYAPLFLDRPVLPLSIAGIAQAETYSSGYGDMAAEAAMDEYAPAPAMESRAMAKSAPASEKKKSLGGAALETPTAQAAGDQFQFTIKKPVTLARQQSAMIPLVESPVKAEKISVFSGSKAMAEGTVHPMLCAELTNSSGMKLPAGPITVFDDGTYAGDALIEFFPENDKRIIAFGEDLSVNGSVTSNTNQETMSVALVKGVLTITRRNTYSKTYTFKNAAARSRKIVIEHPIMRNAQLASPTKFEEKTDSVYRFSLNVPAGGEAKYEIKEQSPAQETVVLSQLKIETMVYYSSSRDMSAKVKSALEKAIEFKRKSDSAKAALAALITKKDEKIAEEGRIRANLDSVGTDTQQGKDYLKKLSAADTEIDSLSDQIQTARKTVQDTQSAYESYVTGLTLE